MAVAELHPSIADLEAFTLGALDDPSFAAVEAHVAACPACQERAAGASGDTLVELLRRAHARRSTGPIPWRSRGASADAGAGCGSPEAVDVPPAAQTNADDTEAPRRLPPELGAARALSSACVCSGAGGMGAVYEAEHRVMQRPVAAEGHQPRLHRQRRRRRALPPRGPRRRPPVPSEHRHRLRRRGRRRHAFPGHGVRRGRQPGPAGEGTRPAAGGRGVRLRPAGGAGLAARPRARHGPPRRQAGQPDARCPDGTGRRSSTSAWRC